MDAKECRFCAYADSNRVNQHGEIRCKRYSCYTRKFDTCEDFATRFGLIVPSLIQYHSETAKGEVRGQKLNEPIFTVDGSNRYGLQIPYLSKFYGGVVGSDIKRPMPTVTAIDHNTQKKFKKE